jgi:adenosylhomocysteinase
MEKRVHVLPEEQDQELAQLKLETMGLAIDRLSDEQRRYATDYTAGT